jgi:hypothetical protein
MRLRLLSLLVAASLSLPALTAAPMARAEEEATVTRVSASAEERPQRRGLFALFAPAQKAPPAEAEDAARAELKVAVQAAVETRPKGRLWCVPFARAITGVSLRGNARTWWSQAKGRYERGNDPQIGAVMAFSGSRAMPKGHVAVVSKVVSPREILVDHANWERNRISLDNLVVDVSENNDWSEVRVANADGTLGRVNPVYGFIYN